MQGDVLPLDGRRLARPARWTRAHHRYALMAQKPRVSTPGARSCRIRAGIPGSTTMTGMVLKLKPGAMHEPHWHPTPVNGTMC